MNPPELREDLRQEVILIICELPAAKIQQLCRSKGLEFYTVRVILNQMKSRKSPFFKKYRNAPAEYSFERDDFNYLSPYHEIEFEERQLRETLEDLALEEIDRLYWYNKGLMELYLKFGNFRAIETETRIPFASCYKTIKKSFEEIKLKVKPQPLDIIR